MKKAVIILLIFAFCTPIYAEQITRVAVLDYARILSSFYNNSSEAQRIESLKKNFASEVREIQDDIQKLEEKKLDAEDSDDSVEILELDRQIEDKKQYYREYVRVRGNQIQKAVSNLSSSNAVAGEILNAIQYVAESGGYSVVIKRSDSGLIWWSYSIDITENVLKRLQGDE